MPEVGGEAFGDGAGCTAPPPGPATTGRCVRPMDGRPPPTGMRVPPSSIGFGIDLSATDRCRTVADDTDSLAGGGTASEPPASLSGTDIRQLTWAHRQLQRSWASRHVEHARVRRGRKTSWPRRRWPIARLRRRHLRHVRGPPHTQGQAAAACEANCCAMLACAAPNSTASRRVVEEFRRGAAAQRQRHGATERRPCRVALLSIWPSGGGGASASRSRRRGARPWQWRWR